MFRYDPVTGEFANDDSIYTVRKCGPKWYLIKQVYVGHSRKYHKNIYCNRIIGVFDHYETAARAQSYLMTGNITTSTNSTWCSTYITHFETQTTYHTYTTGTTNPVVTTTFPRVLTQAPDEEVTIG
jgi:hypothetical protein